MSASRSADLAPVGEPAAVPVHRRGMTERAPLVPADIDLRDFSYMPLEFRRLFTSETWLLAKPDEKLAALALWCESWHQVPAGSLPDNDRMLAHLSQAGGRWPKVKDHALRGWVKCTDGRLYHPVVASKALEAWEKKQEQRLRTLKARMAGIEKRLRDEAVTGIDRDQLQQTLQELRQQLSQGLLQPPREEKGSKGKRREGIRKVKDPSAAARRPPDGNGEPPITLDLWQAYAGTYQTRYGVPPVRNRKVNAMLAKFIERVGAADAPDIAGWYVASNRGLYVSSRHCVDLLLRDAEALAMECKTGRRMTDTQARQVDATANRGQVFLDLLENPKGNA